MTDNKDDPVVEHHRHPVPVEVVPQDVICLPEYAIKQRDLIVKLTHKVELMEASRGALNASSIRTILGIVGMLTTIGTAVAAMWLQASTEPTRASLSSVSKDVATIQRDLEKDEARIQSTSVAVAELQTETLRTSDVEERLQSIILRIDSSDGKNSRIIEKRIEPRIARDEARLATIEQKLAAHLEKK